MATWIDFKELRRHIKFSAVLEHYGVELKLKAGGKQHQGFCPLPTHTGEGRSPSFSANLEKGIFQCFGCGAKGNAIEFACLMQGLDSKNGDEFRKAALMLKELFLPGESEKAPAQQKKTEAKKAETAAPRQAKPEAPVPPAAAPVINAALDFELKGLDANHGYLKGRGFTPGTIAHFGLGYCGRGLMAGRIAIPLHDAQGALIGYAGRLVDETAVSEAQPKYKFPAKREREGVVHEFHKSLFLYNGHRIAGPVDRLVIVEGFPSVWWLWQAGFKTVVGLMGSSCSERQAELVTALVGPRGHVWIMPDGDDAGGRCAESVLARVAPHRFTRWVKLSPGKQPTDCSADQLATMLSPGGVR